MRKFVDCQGNFLHTKLSSSIISDLFAMLAYLNNSKKRAVCNIILHSTKYLDLVFHNYIKQTCEGSLVHNKIEI